MPNTEESQQLLKTAWDDLIRQLQDARDIIDNPERFAPEADSRTLAEGYRYLSGFIHHGIERSFHEDPDFPAFRNALSIFNKSTIDNSDAIYFYAPINGRQHYLIEGRVAQHEHWRGADQADDGPLAPQYVIFETTDGQIAGDSGELMELMPGFRTGFGTLASNDIEVDEHGRFQLMLGPDKPEDYKGHFICTVKPPREEGGEDRVATYVSGRQLFHNWAREEPIHLDITCLETAGKAPKPIDPNQASAQLEKMGGIVRGQMKFWLEFYDRILNVKGTHDPANGTPYFMPVNGYNTPNAASSDTGGGMSTNIYAGGIFDLAEDEAFYIEATFTGKPVYSSVHLGNLWGESPDYANHQSSLNLHQMYIGDDGVQRWIVSHKDPGIQNWLDTTGLTKGFLSHRWAYSDMPEKENWPTISGRKIAFSEIDDLIPAHMPRISTEQREADIAVRQKHVRRRFRVF